MPRKKYPTYEPRPCHNCGAEITVILENYFDYARRKFFCAKPGCKEAEKKHRGKHEAKIRARNYRRESEMKRLRPKRIKAEQEKRGKCSRQDEYVAALKRHYELSGSHTLGSSRVNSIY